LIIVSIFGVIIVLIGIWGLLTKKNIIKIIISFTILDTGVHLIMVSIGYIKGRTAPILDNELLKNNPISNIVDPIPSALVLTAIVIGLAITALMLVFVVKMYNEKKSLNVEDYKK